MTAPSGRRPISLLFVKPQNYTICIYSRNHFFLIFTFPLATTTRLSPSSHESIKSINIHQISGGRSSQLGFLIRTVDRHSSFFSKRIKGHPKILIRFICSSNVAIGCISVDSTTDGRLVSLKFWDTPVQIFRSFHLA